jgi:hypothetical protein
MTMFVFRLGDFLHWIAGTVVGLLLLECPAVIFAYSAFVSRMTSGYDVIKLCVAKHSIGLPKLVGRTGHAIRSFTDIYSGALVEATFEPSSPPPQRLHRPVSCTKRNIFPQHPTECPPALIFMSLAALPSRSAALVQRLAPRHSGERT